jgi:hypothetical protein
MLRQAQHEEFLDGLILSLSKDEATNDNKRIAAPAASLFIEIEGQERRGAAPRLFSAHK